MRTRVHDLFLHHTGDLALNTFGNGDVGGLAAGLFEGDGLFAVRALRHARIMSMRSNCPHSGLKLGGIYCVRRLNAGGWASSAKVQAER